MQDKQHINIVVAGHVDHSKSTAIGRHLADTHTLPDGKIEAIRRLCKRTSKSFEYAFLPDALKDERAQGITIDTARDGEFTASGRLSDDVTEILMASASILEIL